MNPDPGRDPRYFGIVQINDWFFPWVESEVGKSKFLTPYGTYEDASKIAKNWLERNVENATPVFAGSHEVLANATNGTVTLTDF